LKLYRRVSKQHYFKKGVYEYEQIMVPIPKEFHKLVKPFLGRDLEILVKILLPAQDGLEIILKPKKASDPPEIVSTCRKMAFWKWLNHHFCTYENRNLNIKMSIEFKFPSLT